jgi:hypothetical protein
LAGVGTIGAFMTHFGVLLFMEMHGLLIEDSTAEAFTIAEVVLTTEVCLIVQAEEIAMHQITQEEALATTII